LAPYLTQRWTEAQSKTDNTTGVAKMLSKTKVTFESVASTSIVATPTQYLRPHAISGEKVILVSFARSGNSPESIAAIKIADQILGNDVAHIFITCTADGELAKMAESDTAAKSPNRFLFLTPTLSNDQGFAMTSSFTCMMLAGALIFDSASDQQFEAWVSHARAAGESVIARETEIQQIVDADFDRIVYLGSGCLTGLAREAQLKILELTAGQIATVYDSSMGFRHGPKSFINSKTLVFGFVSGNDYTRRYDLDVLEEVNNDQIATRIYAIGDFSKSQFSGSTFEFELNDVPDLYLALPSIAFAQTFAVMASLKVQNTPDTPSKSGTVNRVVKGVTIYDFA
jgi:tagatose-6-phosphate ketose/aldose isomerase